MKQHRYIILPCYLISILWPFWMSVNAINPIMITKNYWDSIRNLPLLVFQCRPSASQYETTITMICNIQGGSSSMGSNNNDDNDDTHHTTTSSMTKELEPPSDTNMTNKVEPSGYKTKISIQESTFKAKQLFLDKISLVSTILSRSEKATVERTTQHSLLDNDEFDGEDDEITLQSDLTRPGRKICVVTTATIPWFTGTAVNPLLRAAYLHQMARNIMNHRRTTDTTLNSTLTEEQYDEHHHEQSHHPVTLMIPWLELETDRHELYGNTYNFTSPNDQEEYIRKWLREEASMPQEADPDTGIKIVFYNARFHPGLKSIFAMGDMLSLIPDEDADVVILEEPEHLNWYRAPGKGWTQKFRFVIGIIHTNYVEYVSGHYSGLWTAPATKIMSSAMIRAYCHVVIKLSDTLQTFAEEKERTVNVHGVRDEFLQEGIRRASMYQEVDEHLNADNDEPMMILNRMKDLCASQKQNDTMSITDINSEAESQVYFIGKILWAKGLDIMLDLESYYRQCTGNFFAIDIFGSGPEEKEIRRAFHGRSFTSEVSRTSTSSTTQIIKKQQQRHSQLNSTSNDMDDNEEMITEEKKTTTFSMHVAKLSRPLKNVKESLDDLELPKSFHELRRNPIPAKFKGRVDHASVKNPKIFVNPSVSEVLCTTTAEALAMNKFVIIPVHPSNTFFLQFDNCLAYRNKFEFVANLHWALSREPYPLSPEQRRLLTWEDATERLVKAVAITRREAKERHKLGTSKLDDRIAWFHNQLGDGYKGDFVRKVLGAGPASDQYAYLSKQKQEDSSDEDVLSTKFVKSSFTEAIRETLANAFPSWALAQAESES
jgi:digalactosyldiacylglycerol synthase